MSDMEAALTQGVRWRVFDLRISPDRMSSWKGLAQVPSSGDGQTKEEPHILQLFLFKFEHNSSHWFVALDNFDLTASRRLEIITISSVTQSHQLFTSREYRPHN